MSLLRLIFRGGRRWQDDATAILPRTRLVGLFLTGGVVLWLVGVLTARHHLLAGPVHVVLVIAFASLLVLLSGRGKGVRGDVRQLRAILSIMRLRRSAPRWQHLALRVGCIVMGVHRKDG